MTMPTFAPKILTPADAAKSLRIIADEHEEWAGTATVPSEAGYHMARLLVLRTAADLLESAQAGDAVDPGGAARGTTSGPRAPESDLASLQVRVDALLVALREKEEQWRTRAEQARERAENYTNVGEHDKARTNDREWLALSNCADALSAVLASADSREK